MLGAEYLLRLISAIINTGDFTEYHINGRFTLNTVICIYSLYTLISISDTDGHHRFSFRVYYITLIFVITALPLFEFSIIINMPPLFTSLMMVDTVIDAALFPLPLLIISSPG